MERVLSVSKQTAVEPVVVQQNDEGSRSVRFLLLDSGTQIDLTGCTVQHLYRKNGATSMPYTATVADGWAEVQIPADVMANAGDGEMQLVVSRSGFRLHSFTLPFTVKASLSFVGEVESPADDPMAVNWKNLPGKPTAFPPSAHTHTPAQAGALPVDGKAADAAMLGGLLPGQYNTPYNHLDNSRFEINQRGQAEYAATGYVYDRWRFRSSGGGKVSKRAKGIRITAGTGGICGVYQRMATKDFAERFDALAGKPVTIVAKISENTLDSIFLLQLQDTNGTTTESTGAVSIASGSIAAQKTGLLFATGEMPTAMTNDGLLLVARTSSNASSGYIDLEWIAVYEGTYTAETLPVYQPKGYAAELLECQRYLYAIAFDGATITPLTVGLANAATTLRWALDLPVPLAPTGVVPTVAVGSTVVLRAYQDRSYQTLDGAEVTVKHVAGNTVLLVAAGSFEANQMYLVTGHTSASDPTNVLISNEI